MKKKLLASVLKYKGSLPCICFVDIFSSYTAVRFKKNNKFEKAIPSAKVLPKHTQPFLEKTILENSLRIGRQNWSVLLSNGE